MSSCENLWDTVVRSSCIASQYVAQLSSLICAVTCSNCFCKTSGIFFDSYTLKKKFFNGSSECPKVRPGPFFYLNQAKGYLTILSCEEL